MKKNNLLLAIMIELVKILHDLNTYGMPVMMHVQPLHLILLEGNIHYNVIVLREKKMVQSMHITTTKYTL